MQGKTINGFELKRILGKGGMAEVWYAENEIGMKAAVKIMSEMLAHSSLMQERFLNEAKVMVKLDHPNIRKVYGYGSVDDRPAIIMEYLDGIDLKMKMRSGQRFTEEELEKWWNQIADALNYTHAQDIVHRDIKPSNIFIDQNGNAKLLDFGIAKVADTSTGTQTGSTLGTRIYMSPEQVKDPKRVGPRSDVYSLAVSYVHLLTGKPPYDLSTSSDYDIQVNIVTKPIDMSGVPVEWQRFLTPYLNKEANRRPALRHFTTELPEMAPVDEDSTLADQGQEQAPVTKNPDSQVFRNETPTTSKPYIAFDSLNGGSEGEALSPKPEDKSKTKKSLWVTLIIVNVALILFLVSFLPKQKEKKIYNSCQSVEDYRNYIAQYPEGQYVFAAMTWIDNYIHDSIADMKKIEDENLKAKAPQGAVKGLFSVGTDSRVFFSQGNLQYQASTNTWRFAEHQWDYVGGVDANTNHWGTVEGSDNGKLSKSYSGWIDLFGYGTSGWNGGDTYHQPYDYYRREQARLLYGPPFGADGLFGEAAHADWGVHNPISNGGNQAGMWRTLSDYEWNFVFFKRSTASGLRFVMAAIDELRKGLLLFPDDWDNSDNFKDGSVLSEVMSEERILEMEKKGVVYLPCGGNRCGKSYADAGWGYYWTSSNMNQNYAYSYCFPTHKQDSIVERDHRECSDGLSVRLVYDAK